MHFHDDGAGRLVLRRDARELLEYVYRPTDAAVESPRPYALLRTPAGRDVTAYRPADHVWHKGLSLALPHVGSHNFWGGPTYTAGEGYVQLPNNGAQQHRSFDLGGATASERLDWTSQAGERVLTEHRTLIAHEVDAAAWALTWHSALRNETDAALAFGSPTSRGRPDAGYAGIFWRGPAAFTGAPILGPDGRVDDAARGRPSPWLAAQAADAGVVMIATDATAPWFARTAEYAGLGPAPFFFDETVVEPGETLALSTAILVADGDVAPYVADADLIARLRSAASAPVKETAR
ncbi:PmoA family protein [Microbacterium sp. SLBN-146]|uniref:DUF6807 domain-containing protein n=1 Tax=Microbacterium sp. SLBN-146 TaxID=2768457 RepID=UPI001152E718|nr:PmoA family protein [Microbacterium sp. SLBN-146]TQJ30070.1 methane monooxygenase PmoA-like [Microbacterium sp. SLBN-146]